MSERVSQTVQIANDLGIHLRAAGVLVQTAGQFKSDIWIERRGTRANGKSIMSVLSLAAGKGAQLQIIAEGDDARDAVKAVVELIENRFEGP